jgi:transcriptional regulator with XRE-family HTH domain
MCGMGMAEIIRRRRTELGLSEAELAAKIGVPRRQVTRYETGRVQPGHPLSAAIAEALGISIDDLHGGAVPHCGLPAAFRNRDEARRTT